MDACRNDLIAVSEPSPSRYLSPNVGRFWLPLTHLANAQKEKYLKAKELCKGVHGCDGEGD